MNGHRRFIAYSVMASWAWLVACIVATSIVLIRSIEVLYRAVLICDLIPLLCQAVSILISWRRTKADVPEVAP